MKIAVLADVKANEAALNAVLDHCQQMGVDQIWVIGSLLSFGPDAVAVVDRLRLSEHSERCLIGHPDRIILERESHNSAEHNPSLKKSMRWLYRKLHPHWWSGGNTRRRWTWLNQRKFHGDNGELEFFSGTPLNPEFDYLPVLAVNGRNERLVPHFQAIRTRAFVGVLGLPGIAFEDSEMLEWQRVVGSEQRIHVGPRKFIASPGAVGQPRDGDPRAAYAVYDGDYITWFRVPYDIPETQRRIRRCPHLSSHYADRLEFGR